MPRIDELRLIARVARMYFEWDMRQSEIAKQLDLSQATGFSFNHPIQGKKGSYASPLIYPVGCLY